LAIGVAIGSFTIADHVFLQCSINADENSYLFQAHNFHDGTLARPFPPNEYAFRHGGIVLDRKQGWFSRYPFGHPLFLVPGIWLGNPYLWIAISSALSLLLVMALAKQLGGIEASLWAGLLLAASPFFLFYHGTLLSHTSGLLAVAVMMWAYVRWRREKKTALAVCAGLAWAFYVNNRTYSALLLAAPLACDALYALYRNRNKQQLLQTIYFALASSSGVVALFLYNELVTGKARKMTYLAYNPTEKLGFGPRIYDRVNHTFMRGAANMWDNLLLLDTWLLGFSGSLLVALAFFLIAWKKPFMRLFASMLVVLPLGYIYFWYHGPRMAGPGYYFELLPLIVVGAALGMQRVQQRIGWIPMAIAYGLLLCVSVYFSISSAPVLKARQKPKRAILDEIESLPPQSLLFLCRAEHNVAFQNGNDMILNPRGLDSKILIAHWIPEAHRAMVEHFNERTPYQLIRHTDGTLDIIPKPSTDESIAIGFTMGSVLRNTGTNIHDPDHPGHVIRVARHEEHKPGFLALQTYRFLPPGAYVMEFELQAHASTNATSPIARLEVAADYGVRILAKTSVDRTQEWTTHSLAFDLDGLATIEPRVWYYGTGTVEIRSIRITERSSTRSLPKAFDI
jgi:hypothetical protein